MLFRSLLDTSCRLNLAVHLATGAGAVQRVAWIPDGQKDFDPLAMTPATWGWANAGVRIDWSPVDRPASLAVAISNAVGTTALDLPGAGTFQYWLAPLYADGEGQ